MWDWGVAGRPGLGWWLHRSLSTSAYFLRPLLVLLDLLKTKKDSGTTCLSRKSTENAHLAAIRRLQSPLSSIPKISLQSALWHRETCSVTEAVTCLWQVWQMTCPPHPALQLALPLGRTEPGGGCEHLEGSFSERWALKEPLHITTSSPNPTVNINYSIVTLYNRC